MYYQFLDISFWIKLLMERKRGPCGAGCPRHDWQFAAWRLDRELQELMYNGIE